MGCTVKRGSQGLAEGKGSLEGEGGGKGTKADRRCAAKRPLLRTVAIFHVAAGTGCRAIPGFCLSDLSSATGWLWSFLQSMKFAPGPVRYSSFFLPWPLPGIARRPHR